MTYKYVPDMKREYEATHVQITVPDDAWNYAEQEAAYDAEQSKNRFGIGPFCAPFENGPYDIVLDTGEFVWVRVTREDDVTGWDMEDVKLVTDGRSTDDRASFSHEGDRVYSIPAAWCKFLDPEEADAAMVASAMDDRPPCS